MKQPIESENTVLSESELCDVRGGYPAGPGPHLPEDPTGRPLPAWPAGKRRPGETPPIIIIDRPLA